MEDGGSVQVHLVGLVMALRRPALCRARSPLRRGERVARLHKQRSRAHIRTPQGMSGQTFQACSAAPNRQINPVGRGADRRGPGSSTHGMCLLWASATTRAGIDVTTCVPAYVGYTGRTGRVCAPCSRTEGHRRSSWSGKSRPCPWSRGSAGTPCSPPAPGPRCAPPPLRCSTPAPLPPGPFNHFIL